MKPVRFVGGARADLLAFPEAARREAGYQLFLIQSGSEPRDWKAMPTVGQGVREIRIQEPDGAFRVVDTASLLEAVSVLHAFAKKTQATAQRDLNLIRFRLRLVSGER